MQRFKNILVHVHANLDDQPALQRAAKLAHDNSAKLTIIDVLEEHHPVAHDVLKTLHLERVLPHVEQEHAAALERLAAPLRGSGLEVNVLVARGVPFVEIVRTALREQHDLVFKTVASEGLLKRAFFGSTDMHLLRKCPTPLWLMKPGTPAAFRRILVPLDPNMEHGVKMELGMNLLRLAVTLAERDQAEVLVVHAWKPLAEETLQRHMDRQQFGDYVAAWEKEAHKRTWRFLSAFERAIPPKCFHLVQGDPGVVIPHFAKEHAVDLVVMGTLGRLGTHGMFIGDTAERVLNQLECSVLALKPSGFVSPIRLA